MGYFESKPPSGYVQRNSDGIIGSKRDGYEIFND